LKRTILFAILLLALLAGCRARQRAENIVAEVNGRGIPAAEVEKLYRAQLAESEQKPSGEQEQIQRLMILRALIDNEILLQRAEKMNLVSTDSEVEAKFAERKNPMTDQEFQQRLKERGLTAEDLKNDIRRELTLEKIFNKEIRSKVQVTEAEINKTYEENKSGFNVPETRFHVAQIVVTPDPSVPVANLRNDKAKNEAEARRKIERISAGWRRSFPKTPPARATAATWGSSRHRRWTRPSRN
jgi:peptidyl-prolyl cis-trans isomerase SurA